jgi:hypothetical protein
MQSILIESALLVRAIIVGCSHSVVNKKSCLAGCITRIRISLKRGWLTTSTETRDGHRTETQGRMQNANLGKTSDYYKI